MYYQTWENCSGCTPHYGPTWIHHEGLNGICQSCQQPVFKEVDPFFQTTWWRVAAETVAKAIYPQFALPIDVSEALISASDTPDLWRQAAEATVKFSLGMVFLKVAAYVADDLLKPQRRRRR